MDPQMAMVFSFWKMHWVSSVHPGTLLLHPKNSAGVGIRGDWDRFQEIIIAVSESKPFLWTCPCNNSGMLCSQPKDNNGVLIYPNLLNVLGFCRRLISRAAVRPKIDIARCAPPPNVGRLGRAQSAPRFRSPGKKGWPGWKGLVQCW